MAGMRKLRPRFPRTGVIMRLLFGPLRQWCHGCGEFTQSKPCLECGPPEFGCAVCGGHPGHETPDDDQRNRT